MDKHDGLFSSKIEKRLGADRLQQCRDALEKRDFASVADTLLSYYDKLYDKHIKNKGGTGSGSGSRAAPIKVIEQEETDELRTAWLAREVARVAAEYACEVK